MARRRDEHFRVLGPYRHHRRWRVILVGPDGRRHVETFSDEREAAKAAKAARRRAPGLLTVEQAIAKYEQFLEAKGNKRSSRERTGRRLRELHELETAVVDVTPLQLRRRYEQRSSTLAVDSHRNELNEAKTFWRWCVRSGFVPRSPAKEVEPHGRRKRGKPQLRRAEARALYDEAYRLAGEGHDGALAVLTFLLMGMRSGELLERKVRDVDVTEENVLLWIDAGKTESAKRCYETPDPVAGLLARRVAGRGPEEWLFPAQTQSGHRSLVWAISATHRLCAAAGVPQVTPHGLRGTWATLTREAGVASHVIARELGHAGDMVTKRHYIAPGSDEYARTRKMLKVVGGDERERE